MDYLTAMEISLQWNISNRMVAYYCENGRIDGAIKKGNVWFIPIGSEKPIDKRYSKENIKIKNRNELQEVQHDINEADSNNISAIYHTSDVYNNLGFSRETLRYYEKIGLIQPKRSQYSQYREFNLYDMSRLMTIDFYKKRGFTPAQIKDLLKATKLEEYDEIMQRQIDRLLSDINYLQNMLKRLKDAKAFYNSASEQIGEFTIKNLPTYYVQECIPSFASFGEYRDKVLSYINLENDDILSNMVRTITFDETGYKSSKMYIVKSASKTSKTNKKIFLENGKSLYTTLIADNNDTTIMEKMFYLCHEWASKKNLSFRGVAYIFIRCVMLNEPTDRNYYEVWIPLK